MKMAGADEKVYDKNLDPLGIVIADTKDSGKFKSVTYFSTTMIIDNNRLFHKSCGTCTYNKWYKHLTTHRVVFWPILTIYSITSL